MSDLFILAADRQTPVLVEDVGAWARWHRENPDALIVKTDVWKHPNGEVYTIETKFWGSELNSARMLNPNAPSLLFQTSAFVRSSNTISIQERAGTWAEAEEQHARVMAQLRAQARAVEMRAGGRRIAIPDVSMPEEVCIVQT